MAERERFDAIVVGAGPNGLAAAITLARAGHAVQLLEGAATVGGGSRSAELTLPGFIHDVCSAVHPLGRASPCFAEMPLAQHGLEWIEPDVQLAHPLDHGTAIAVRDLHATAERLGPDAEPYLRLVGPVVRDWGTIIGELTGPFRIPRDPKTMWIGARFGARGLRSAATLARHLRTSEARALLAGCAAHSMLSLGEPFTGAVALVFLASTHAVGWPIARGGSQRIADALAAYFRELGGEIVTDTPVDSIAALAPHRAVLLDVTPRQLLEIAGAQIARQRWGPSYVQELRRFRYGPGVFKIDLALDGPIPWRDPEVARAASVHLGGTFEEIATSEAEVTAGRIPERPFVLLAQPSRFDPTRAPAGQHTVWAYCHVPNGATVDMTERIIAQIERFAPGVRDRILAIARRGPADFERYNPNYVGGDIAGGRPDIWQFFTRPVWRPDPYRTPDPSILLCSSSTPPGAGVHGLCGWYAARSALRGILRR